MESAFGEAAVACLPHAFRSQPEHDPYLSHHAVRCRADGTDENGWRRTDMEFLTGNGMLYDGERPLAIGTDWQAVS